MGLPQRRLALPARMLGSISISAGPSGDSGAAFTSARFIFFTVFVAFNRLSDDVSLVARAIAEFMRQTLEFIYDITDQRGAVQRVVHPR